MEFMDDRTRTLMSAFIEVRNQIFGYSPLPTVNEADFILMRHVHIFSREFATPEEPGIRLTSLARALHNAPPTVSQRVKELETAGYLCRVRSEADRRVVFVQMTEQGNAVMREGMAACDALFSRVIERFGAERMNEFIAMIGEFGATFAAERSAAAKAAEPTPQKGTTL